MWYVGRDTNKERDWTLQIAIYGEKYHIKKKKKTSNPKGPKEEMRNSIVRIAWLSLLWQEKNVIASFGNWGCGY